MRCRIHAQGAGSKALPGGFGPSQRRLRRPQY